MLNNSRIGIMETQDPYHKDNYIGKAHPLLEEVELPSGEIIFRRKDGKLRPIVSKEMELKRGFFSCRVPMWIAYAKKYIGVIYGRST